MTRVMHSAPSPFDYSCWPVVRFSMPEIVPDACALAQIAEFEALLARNERFVMAFDGPIGPRHSKRFMQLYAEWSKRHLGDLKRLCAGAVRLEPDEQKRKSFSLLLLNALQRAMTPYPTAVVGSPAELEAQASKWLAG